jgi:hypothetical protein
MSGVNGLQQLFDAFTATISDSAAMWKFYSELSTPLKIIIWDRFPQYQAALRAEEREQQ